MRRQGTTDVDYGPVRAFHPLLEHHDANTRTLQHVHLPSDCDLCRNIPSQTLPCAGSVEQEQKELITIQSTVT